MTDEPNTQAPERESTALDLRLPSWQQKNLERGELVVAYLQRVPIVVVDFYPEPAPA